MITFLIAAHRSVSLRAGGITALVTLILMAACSSGESREANPDGTVERRAPVHVDSIFPIEEEIRRFREGLEEPAGLGSGAGSSIDGLVDAFLRALEAGDTERLATLTLDRAEFAWLYYPHTMYVERPYQLGPALVWYQQQNLSGRGLTRALRRYDGETLYDTGVDCQEPAEAFGAGRIRHGCRVVGELPTGEEVVEVLFGSILELDGRFKFVGYANEL